MSICGEFEEVYSDLDSIPEDVLKKLNRVFKNRFNGGVECLLEEIKSDLPLIFEQISEGFTPKLGVRTICGMKKVNFILDGGECSLVTDLYNENFYDLYSIEYEYSFFPEKIRSYYYLTCGFQLVMNGAPRFNWLDLPMSLINRRDIKDFESISTVKNPCKDESVKMYKVWCLTSNDEIIVVDEVSSGLFYSSLKDLYDLKRIEDISGFWDRYCSFIIKHKNLNHSQLSDFINEKA
ncbi:hypothetical protein [Enterovibrio norvegicus]|uniref:hypothetical protein n=1 Tax=Enterovibrio norvegicus TaxID=188144 RepID=UPI000C8485C9|nr:hypothetical protein [Enterovibrio norvegicus]PML78521.1 hypothetical protein BCT69_03595 [Enterovibrio norvegicus]